MSYSSNYNQQPPPPGLDPIIGNHNNGNGNGNGSGFLHRPPPNRLMHQQQPPHHIHVNPNFLHRPPPPVLTMPMPSAPSTGFFQRPPPNRYPPPPSPQNDWSMPPPSLAPPGTESSAGAYYRSNHHHQQQQQQQPNQTWSNYGGPSNQQPAQSSSGNQQSQQQSLGSRSQTSSYAEQPPYNRLNFHRAPSSGYYSARDPSAQRESSVASDRSTGARDHRRGHAERERGWRERSSSSSSSISSARDRDRDRDRDYRSSTRDSHRSGDRDRERGRDDGQLQRSYRSASNNRSNNRSGHSGDTRRSQSTAPASGGRERRVDQRSASVCPPPAAGVEPPSSAGDATKSTATGASRSPWIRSSPAEPYYERVDDAMTRSTPQLDALCTEFETDLLQRGGRVRAALPPYVRPVRQRKHKVCRHKSEKCSSSDTSEDDFNVDEDDVSMEELTNKIKHPQRLHKDLWHNEPGEMNDGPLCRCSAKSRRSGIRHGIYPGETGFERCDPAANNAAKLHHYRVTISPPTNFVTTKPTIITHDQHEYIFEGFSLLAHSPIGELPACKMVRYNFEYEILYIEEPMPVNFTIRELDLFFDYLFVEVLEMLDLNLKPGLDETAQHSCPSFHVLPRFCRALPDNGTEVLAMAEVLRYLLDNSGPLMTAAKLETMCTLSDSEWQKYVDHVKDMVVTNPAKKPCAVRVDQLDREVRDLPECRDADAACTMHPIIVHFGIRPPQLSYAGNPDYQRAWRDYVKFRHLLANMSKPSEEDKERLEDKEVRLQEMRTQGRMKRNITVAIPSRGFYRTGIMCDVVQHAMLIPVLTAHLRFHHALDVLESNISHRFADRNVLQLALTHPSYKENFGTNPDHARNSLTNCGIRQPVYGDRKIHYQNTRKRGINTLINIMSQFGMESATASDISHNERLEFLGDAVVEFLTSIHLFFMFPELEEGGLATYRAAIVQNQHLAVLARKLHLEQFMLYAHGSDLCHELELRHAMANCFEALMGALLLDGGIAVADKVYSYALFHDDPPMKATWDQMPPHPLQEQEPFGDRQWIESYSMLKDLTRFEDSIGMRFKHIRLLARAFTDRSIGYTLLTLGSNQRLEFLGDTVLQLICSEYLYGHFPKHHEGHLSLLRSSLVNNRTQAVVCDDLGMTQYAVYSNPKPELKTKDRADLLEAFLGAMYVDRGLEPCQVFCHVCLFPRLADFIMNQDWNDSKSKLQQCCLTLRTMEGGEPDIPVYKVIECIGPTNTRVYTVAVYFRGKRLASATGHSIQQAEMNAAETALVNSRELFPQLDHQKRVIAQSIKRQKGKDYQHQHAAETSDNGRQRSATVKAKSALDDESNLPKQYRMREDISSDENESDFADGATPGSTSRRSPTAGSTSGSPPCRRRRGAARRRRSSDRRSSASSSSSGSDEQSGPRKSVAARVPGGPATRGLSNVSSSDDIGVMDDVADDAEASEIP